jgi:hypothetical protein
MMIMEKIPNVLFGDAEIPERARKMIAFVLLLAADILFCIPFRGWGNILGLIPWYTTVRLTPDFVTGLLAIVFVIPLYWRRVLSGRITVFGIAISILTIFLTASYIKMLLTGGASDSMNIGLSIRYFVLFAVLLLSWVGLRLFAGLGFCALFISAIANVTSVSNIMGIWGFVIIVSTFLGIVLQAPFGSFGDFFTELVASYKQPAERIRTDMEKSVKKASSIMGGKIDE